MATKKTKKEVEPELARPWPLQWPVSQPRTKADKRRSSQVFQMSYPRMVAHLREQVRMLGGTRLAINSNHQIGESGAPLLRSKDVLDPAVACYFLRQGQPVCIAVDRYTTVQANLHGCGLTLEALRAVERHGGATLLNQAFRGFLQLPEPARTWWQVLGCDYDATPEVIRERKVALTRVFHSELGTCPSHDQLAEVNAAAAEGLKLRNVEGQ